MSMRLSLGVDAGATRCRARLRGPDGAVLAEAEGPAANAYVNFAAAQEVARGVVAQALGARESAAVHLGFGVAGISSEGEGERFAAAFPGFAEVRVVNDAVAACLGAHGGKDGGLIISGTGSAGCARVRGQDIVIGGRGFHLGDDGSAARLGLEAARASMRAAEGFGPESGLTREILARFPDILSFVHWAASATPRDWGEFAPLAVAAAGAGDPVALPLVAQSAAGVAALADRLFALGAERIAIVGGLGDALRPFLRPGLSERLKSPLFDPTDGAIALTGGVLPARA